MTPLVIVAAVAVALGSALMMPPRVRLPVRPVADDEGPRSAEGWLRRRRLLLALLCGAGAASFVGGAAGPVCGVVSAVGVWVVIGRAEPADVRRRREEVRRDLPAVVTLVAAALRSGSSPGDAVVLVASALPGAAADRLAPVSARLRLGVPASSVWSDLASDPDLAPLGRTMARADDSGAPVVAAIERLASDLAARARAEVEDRARAVGVKAAVPLGLCLLPSFVLIGIVPLVAGLVGSLGW